MEYARSVIVKLMRLIISSYQINLTVFSEIRYTAAHVLPIMTRFYGNSCRESTEVNVHAPNTRISTPVTSYSRLPNNSRIYNRGSGELNAPHGGGICKFRHIN